MKKNYVSYGIIAHEANDQLIQLIDVLAVDSRSHIILHLDAKAEMSPPLVDRCERGVVQTSDRVSVSWGGFSMIEATRSLLAKFLSNDEAKLFVLLSGSCFPLRNIKQINSELLAIPRDKFSIWFPLFEKESGFRHHNIFNIEKFYFMESRFFNPSRENRIGRNVFQAMKRLNRLIPYRRRPSFSIYKGSQWFATTRDTAHFLTRDRPQMESFFRKTFAPDETFFQTLYVEMLQSQGKSIECQDQEGIIQALHYIPNHKRDGDILDNIAIMKFDRRALQPADVDRAIASPAFFARKCSLTVATALRHRVEQQQGLNSRTFES